MKWILLLFTFSMSNLSAFSDSTRVKSHRHSNSSVNILDGGNIDFLSNGFLRSSTNIFKFNVGNPKGIYLPFYLLVGANVDIKLDDNNINASTAFDMLNNMGGLINFGIDGRVPVKTKYRHTKLDVVYQLAVKSINGYVDEKNIDERFLSKMFLVGFLVKSRAWNPDSPKQFGEFWIKNGITLSGNPSEVVKDIWGNYTNPQFVSHILEAGLLLRGGLNLKFGFYQFLNNKEVNFIDGASFKISANVLLH
ncbi:MAG: hypothetical protein HKO66_01370 [Saprospiraceae bacterium]|nr:hypothetical protein [Saprospiraceae bacterium]